MNVSRRSSFEFRRSRPCDRCSSVIIFTTDTAVLPLQSGSSSPRSISVEPSHTSLSSTRVARSEIKYMPNDTASPPNPNTTSPNVTTPGEEQPKFRIQDQDIEWVAARIVAMIFTRILPVKAWTPGSQDAQMQGLGIDGGDGVSISPPLYRGVARRVLSTRALSTEATFPNDTTLLQGGETVAARVPYTGGRH